MRINELLKLCNLNLFYGGGGAKIKAKCHLFTWDPTRN